MTEIIYYPDNNLKKKILSRPFSDDSSVEDAVKDIIADVRRNGDSALFRYARVLDGAKLETLLVSENEINESVQAASGELKDAIAKASENISTFHRAQIVPEVNVETSAGVRCVQRRVPVQKVGLYVPGGSAPLFSTVLMLAIPAKIAGCEEITLFTPPAKDGTINQAILYAAKVAGVDKIVKSGGAQAVAAMAYGTESISPVDKIFGPGNRYVAAAKQLVSSRVSIDMFAGPSEVMIIADDSAVPRFVAADLLSQAEHGPDSQVLLLTTSESLAIKCREEIDRQLAELSRKRELDGALRNSRIVVMENLEQAVDMANEYAPEHLIIVTENPWGIADKIKAAGSVFIGNYSPESAGDYASGTNHTLPTGGWARSQGGISTDSFCRTITYQELTREGLSNLSRTIETMALAEGLEAHCKAVRVRMEEQ
ncbi:MAG: histidinol dehydrogenase [Bacteroidetes bacterium HGW-Bacteroidetes-14]|jgi:histidinol dehydrogenase|nr:MAG: histidinol dehydrogenase [Bacteroidetes bacterium HGW-Bacteroidetes-14]